MKVIMIIEAEIQKKIFQKTVSYLSSINSTNIELCPKAIIEIKKEIRKTCTGFDYYKAKFASFLFLFTVVILFSIKKLKDNPKTLSEIEEMTNQELVNWLFEPKK